MRLGATPLPDGRTRFCVWAPKAQAVEVALQGREARWPLVRDERGYWSGLVEARPGARYLYVLDGDKERPDPASRLQPEGVHGPSEVVDLAHAWQAPCPRVALGDLVIYELHVGTFTPEGTFDAMVRRLPDLVELGVTALELLPVAQFPGERNWGYDGAHPYAVQASYGGPAALARLVDACHARGLAVILDVVYNHLGPEGTYLRDFGPYFTWDARTPWGQAVNLAGRDSDEVRRYFLDNALEWIRDYRVDGLRLDAVQTFHDPTARTFLEELGEAAHALGEREGRTVHVIAESNANDPRLVTPVAEGGLGLDAVWNDDLHHVVHATLVGEEGSDYFAGYAGARNLARAWNDGFMLQGERSRYRGRRHGRPSGHVPAERFVVYAQNHDQVGNRARGERLAQLVPFEAQKVAAASALLSGGLPLLFMGEEYGERAPFLYFVDHGDAELIDSVRRGRRSDLGYPADMPDPAALDTFLRSKLDWALRAEGRHAVLLAYYRELLRLRREHPALGAGKAGLAARPLDGDRAIFVQRRGAWMVLNLGGPGRWEVPGGRWRKVLDSADPRWGGPGGGALEGTRLELPGPCVVLCEGYE